MRTGKLLNAWEPFVLFLGDVLVLYFSLWATLFLRRWEIPDSGVFESHIQPFTILFALWILVFFIAGLYDKHTTFLKKRIPSIILNAQLVNSGLAILFFYLIPYFGITPKTTLFIFLIVSLVGIVYWRRYSLMLFDSPDRQSALLIGSGEEMEELQREVNGNPRYGIFFVSSLNLNDVSETDFQKEIIERVYAEHVTTVVVDTKHENIVQILPKLYNLIFSGVRFVDMHKVYEDIFDRVPLSLVNYDWFLENISASSRIVYDFLKRAMDIIIAFVLGVISLLVYPFVMFAIRNDDGGPAFIVQERIGRGNKTIRLYKFRSMKSSDSGVWPTPGDKRVTRVGAFIRKTRIDELPQLWNVVRGDLSLIGPRPDIIDLGRTLAKEIPYYMVRNLIAPGLSGWAQIKQDAPPHSIEATRLRLSYDLYYIKNRSLILDLKIALKTIWTLLSRTGK
jgi:exopolysaccharide biosynthesis polyprenyl glycosylphosphotransferase